MRVSGYLEPRRLLKMIRNAVMDDMEFLRSGLYQVRIIEKRPEEDIPVGDNDIRSFEKGIDEGTIRVIDGADGEPIAFLFYRTDHPIMYVTGDIFWIDLIYVKQEYRGRGLGKELYADAVRIAKELGLTKIVIDIFHPNTGSRRFHSGLGFNPFYTIYIKGI
jgi:GNAT superfamily N-acetyltransferase